MKHQETLIRANMKTESEATDLMVEGRTAPLTPMTDKRPDPPWMTDAMVLAFDSQVQVWVAEVRRRQSEIDEARANYLAAAKRVETGHASHAGILADDVSMCARSYLHMRAVHERYIADVYHRYSSLNVRTG